MGRKPYEILIKITVFFLCFNLWGCSLAETGNTGSQQTGDMKDNGRSDLNLASGKEQEEETNPEYYIDENGELKSATPDWQDSATGDQVTINKKYLAEGGVTDPKTALQKQTEKIVDHRELWNIEGTPAFYILDYHSANAGDIKDFQILDVQDDGKRVVYAYETVFYGTSVSGLGPGVTRSGTVPKGKRHINWINGNGAEKGQKENEKGQEPVEIGDAPQTSLEVCCLMIYNTETRNYRVLDIRTGEKNNKKVQNGQEESLNMPAYTSGNRRLFVNKVQDVKKRYVGEYFYYVMYDTYSLIIDENGTVQMQQDMGENIASMLHDYNLKNTTSDKITGYSITNSFADADGRICTAVQTKSEGLQDETEGLSFLLSYTPLNVKESSYQSDNVKFEEQKSLWEDETDLSYEEVIANCPSVYSQFQSKELQDVYLCSAKTDLSSEQFYHDPFLNYFQELAGKFWQSYRSQVKEGKIPDREELWKNAYQVMTDKKWENSEVSKKTSLYDQVMDHVQAPDVVDGGNLDQMFGDTWNMVYYLYDQKEDYSSVSIKNWLTKQVRPADFQVHTETVTRTVEVEEEDGSTHEEEEEAVFVRSVDLMVMAEADLAHKEITKIDSDDNIVNVDGKGIGQYRSQDGKTVISVSGQETEWNTDSEIPDESYGLIFAEDETENSSRRLCGALLGEKGVWILYGSASDSTSGKQILVPYSMAVTPINEFKDKTLIQSESDPSDKASYQMSAQNAMINGPNNVAWEKSNGIFRFTTLQSGILSYSPEENSTLIISAYPYYGSWRNKDGSYTAIGFQVDDVTVGFKDIMKAKIYQIKQNRSASLILTLQKRLRVDLGLREKFLAAGDGWKKVYREYGFDVDKNPDPLLENYAAQVLETVSSYEKQLSRLWQSVGINPDSADWKDTKAQWENRFLYCSSASEVEALINDILAKKKEKGITGENFPEKTADLEEMAKAAEARRKLWE